MSKFGFILFACLTFTTLSACGGGSGGDGSSNAQSVDVFSAPLGPEGGRISSPSGDIDIHVGPNKLRQNYQVTYALRINEKDEFLQVISTTPDMPLDERLALRLTRPESDLLKNRYFAQNNRIDDIPDACQRTWPDINGDGFIFEHVWQGREAGFNKEVDNAINGDPRVRDNLALPRTHIACTSSLRSSVALGDPILKSADHEPVLYVHGFIASGALGGFEDSNLSRDEYFDRFPKLMAELDIAGRRFTPFIYEWRSNSRFQDAAAELGDAIKLIREQTGKSVHVIAHSFGGLVTRTLMQGLAEQSDSNGTLLTHPEYTPAFSQQHIASVTTIGTPHSGVFADNTTVQFDNGPSITLPGGRDGLLGATIEACQAISCYQAGEDWPELRGAFAEALYGTKPQTGLIAYRLSERFSALPNTPMQVLIGLAADATECRKVTGRDTCLLTYRMRQSADNRAGDGLISLRGQRLQPSLGLNPVFFDGVREEHLIGFNTKTFSRGNEDGHLAVLSNGDNIQLPEEIQVDADGVFPEIERRFVEGYSTGYHHSATQYKRETKQKIDGFSLDGLYELPQYTEAGMQNCSSATNCNHNTWHYVSSFLGLHSAP